MLACHLSTLYWFQSHQPQQQPEIPWTYVHLLSQPYHGTSGPDSFKGPLGQALMTEVHKMKVVQFQPVATPLADMDDEVLKDLSRDQLLLYQYTKAIATGNISKKLEAQAAGPLNHSRWLTLAIRIQQLYTRTANPTEGHQMVVDFIQKMYAPSWFWIKSHGKFTSSPSNLHYQMELVMNQPEVVQSIVKPVVQRNAFFADPALLLCSMLESEDDILRRKAVTIIQQIRSKPQKPPRARVLKGIRKHVNPILQWGSRNWWEIIEWEKARIHEPRILERITNEELENMLQTPACFPKYPCHSRSVERAL